VALTDVRLAITDNREPITDNRAYDFVPSEETVEETVA
jgi:hypothetical protein